LSHVQLHSFRPKKLAVALYSDSHLHKLEQHKSVNMQAPVVVMSMLTPSKSPPP
jgi:hypothetical protein